MALEALAALCAIVAILVWRIVQLQRDVERLYKIGVDTDRERDTYEARTDHRLARLERRDRTPEPHPWRADRGD